MAVTPHDLSTAAALEIMRSGGNAVDAAIAANAVQGVVAPETCGVGGDLFALVHSPGDQAPACLNASGRAGSGASAQKLRDDGHVIIDVHGPESITVPGCVDGWYALSERFGALDLAAVMAPAIRHAHVGFPASTEMERSWTMHHGRLLEQPSSGPMYPNGQPPSRGQRIERPLLADTLEAITSGRDAFYIDRMAGAVAVATGGIITTEDMSVDQAEWVEAIGLEVFGLKAWTVPPNSQGYLTLAALSIFERVAASRDPHDPGFHHAVIEAYRAVVGELNEWVSEPATAPVDATDLLDSARLGSLADRFDPAAVGEHAIPAGAAGGTAYLCTIDGNGMGVSLIQSNYHGIGSGICAGETGVWLHNRGAGFNLRPGHPNELSPGHRPLHTLSPTIWTEGQRLAMILGTRGGHHQPQLLAQFAALRLYAGLDVSESQAFPRWTLGEEEHPALVAEDRMTAPVREGLAARGHTVETTESYRGGWGPISAIEIDSEGLRTGSADPRVDTALAATG